MSSSRVKRVSNSSIFSKLENTNKEAQHPSNKKLENLLRYLHAFMFHLSSINDHKLAVITSAFKKQLDEMESSDRSEDSCRSVYKLLEKYFQSFEGDLKNTQGFTCSPITLFMSNQGITKTNGKIIPFKGKVTGSHKMMYNADLIIGLKFVSSQLKFSYRLDYDGPEKKGLHLNMKFKINDTSYKFTIANITPEGDGRFSVPQQEFQYDIIKFKFFFKMTIACIFGELHPTKNGDNKFLDFCFTGKIKDIPTLRTMYEDTTYRGVIIKHLIEKYTADRKEENRIAKREIQYTGVSLDSDMINSLEKEEYQPRKKK